MASDPRAAKSKTDTTDPHKGRRWPWITLATFVLLVVAAPIAYKFYMARPLYEHRTDNLEFKVFQCKKTKDLFTPTRTLVREWRDDGAYHVRVVESDECGIHFTSAAFKTKGDTLILEYRSRLREGPRPMCYCRFEFDYVIKGLAKTDWNVEVFSPDLPEHVYVTRKAGGGNVPTPTPSR